MSVTMNIMEATDMEKQQIYTSEAPAAIGPYSQAIRAGDTLYVSGQIALIPSTGALAGEDITVQTQKVLENIRSILAVAGTDMAHIVKTTVFLKNMDDFSAMNKVYASFFTGACPARSAVQVAQLPRDALVEIETIVAL
jgi:2-iminobutanoate/2-iminopropanoate deaminase